MSWYRRAKIAVARAWRKVTRKTPSAPSKPIEAPTRNPHGLGLVCPDKYIGHYLKLWEYVEVTKVSNFVIDNIIANLTKYKEAERLTKVPWYVIACIHNLEGGQSFSKNMMNGQRLDRVTTWVPRGYGPWNSWEESCIDAFKIKKLPSVWNVENTLYFLEAFNGTGYLRYHKDVNSPYLWSYTNQYTKGKYVSDGKWSSSAVSKQMGAVAVIKELGVEL